MFKIYNDPELNNRKVKRGLIFSIVSILIIFFLYFIYFSIYLSSKLKISQSEVTIAEVYTVTNDVEDLYGKYFYKVGDTYYWQEASSFDPNEIKRKKKNEIWKYLVIYNISDPTIHFVYPKREEREKVLNFQVGDKVPKSYFSQELDWTYFLFKNFGGFGAINEEELKKYLQMKGVMFQKNR